MAITNLSFTINDGATHTNNSMVSVTISFNVSPASDVYWKVAQTTSALASTSYELLASSVSGDIAVTKTTFNSASITINSTNTNPAGTTKYLYLRLREGLTTETSIVSDTIVYDDIAPTFTTSVTERT
jgi:hypothetical protein